MSTSFIRSISGLSRCLPKVCRINQLLAHSTPITSVTSIRSIAIFNKISVSPKTQSIQVTTVRGKKGRKKLSSKSADEESDSDEEKESDNEESVDGADIAVVSVTSVRLDVVCKAVLGIARGKVEELFYAHLIRLNGEKTGKKSETVAIGDEIDWIKGKNKDNLEMLDIFRFEILGIPDIGDNTGRVKIKVKKQRLLTVDNYRDPYDGVLINEPNVRNPKE